MDVLVVGAGVGGLALAHGLLADGHQVRVLEQAPKLREGGAAITIFSNGAAALAGLGTPMAGIGGLVDRMEFRSAEGTLLYRSDLRVLQRSTGFPVVTVARGQLVAQLADRLPEGVVQFDRKVESVTIDGEGVEAVDSSCGRHGGDVLVGADGYRSAVRQAIVDDAAAADSGWVTWQGLTSVIGDLTAGRQGRFFLGNAGFVGMMPAGDGVQYTWFDVPWSRTDPAPASPAAWLRQRFADYAEPVPELLATITDTDLGRYPHVLHQVPDRWGIGPTTLLGDAAHAFPPTQAQGANQTLEDAWLLIRALRQSGDPAGALRRYERKRTARVRRVSRTAASEVTDKPPRAPVRLAARLVPASLAGRVQLSLIRRWSSALHDEQP